MASPRRRRTSPVRVVRALWRYRGRVQALGAQGQADVATAVRSAIDARGVTRAGLGGYRAVMRVLLWSAVGLLALGAVVAVVLWQLVSAPWALAGLAPAAFAVPLLIWRFAWGAPLDWLDEHADPARTVSPEELPEHLRALALQLRELADVPASVSRELDELAGDVEATSGPHVQPR